MNSRLESLKKLVDGPILITGHTGFKGTWLTLLLERLGIEVVGYSLEANPDSLYKRLSRDNIINEKISDIRDIKSFENFVHDTKPKSIIHLAAQPLVLASYEKPLETFEVNVMGTANVLEIARQTGHVETVLAITTDKVYRNDERGIPFIETDPLAGKDPYSASKVGSEAVISAWQNIIDNASGPRIVSLRAGNVIGGGDWASDRLIPDLIRGFSMGKDIQIRNPQSTRPWQHVLDPLVGYLLALKEVLGGSEIRAVNFGPTEKSLSVEKVVEIAKNSWRSKVNLKTEDSQSKLESMSLELDSTLASEVLKWSPAWSQQLAVESSVTWWRRNLVDGIEPGILCSEDLDWAISKCI
jgi:CDP-glucose 4,6-dehydratase